MTQLEFIEAEDGILDPMFLQKIRQGPEEAGSSRYNKKAVLLSEPNQTKRTTAAVEVIPISLIWNYGPKMTGTDQNLSL